MGMAFLFGQCPARAVPKVVATLQRRCEIHRRPESRNRSPTWQVRSINLNPGQDTREQTTKRRYNVKPTHTHTYYIYSGWTLNGTWCTNAQKDLMKHMTFEAQACGTQHNGPARANKQRNPSQQHEQLDTCQMRVKPSFIARLRFNKMWCVVVANKVADRRTALSLID